MDCNTNDFMFPLVADVYYPIVEQSAYGNVNKVWTLDRMLICSLSSAGTAFKEEVKPNVVITQDKILIGRLKEDIRFTERSDRKAITNIIVTNIRDKNCNHIYTETSGPRSGKSTMFEVATTEPYTGPFGAVEYYKVILRRSENQSVDL